MSKLTPDPLKAGVICEVKFRAEQKGDDITNDIAEMIAERIIQDSDYLWDIFDREYERHRDDVLRK